MLLFLKGAFRKSRISRTHHALTARLGCGDVGKKTLKIALDYPTKAIYNLNKSFLG